MTRGAVLVMVVTCSAICLGADPQQVTRDLGADIHEAERAGFSGAVLVAQDGRVVLDRTYGSGAHSPARPRFWVASIGKQFTSVALLKCQERGLLKLTDPISKYLQGVPPDKQSITLVQLLTHTSGFPQNYVAEGIGEREEAVAKILRQPLQQPPGAAFGYSNDNYALAAAIVETVTHERFEDFVRAQLLRPAGLADTGFAATTQASSVSALRSPLPARVKSRHWGWIGSGAMFSTTPDLNAWYEALAKGKVLSAASVEQLFTPYQKIQEGASGLGWFLGATAKGTRYRFTRGNDDNGANGLIYAYPDRGIVVVVLCHAGQRDDDTSWSRAILNMVEERLGL